MKNKPTLIVLVVLAFALAVFSLRVYNNIYEAKPVGSHTAQVRKDLAPSEDLQVRFTHASSPASVGEKTGGMHRITVNVRAGVGENQHFDLPVITDGSNMFPRFVARKGLTSNTWEQIKILRAAANRPPLLVEPSFEGGPIVLIDGNTNAQSN